MTLFDRFYIYVLILVSVVLPFLLLKPMVGSFMLLGAVSSYAIHWLCKHPAWGQLLARILAESMGLLMVLSIFVGFMLVYGHLLNV